MKFAKQNKSPLMLRRIATDMQALLCSSAPKLPRRSSAEADCAPLVERSFPPFLLFHPGPKTTSIRCCSVQTPAES